MDELFGNAPEIIRAAATNPLALSALVVLTLGVLAFIHFRSASELARVTVFVLTGLALLIILGIAFIGTIVREEFASANRPESAPPASTLSTQVPAGSDVIPTAAPAPPPTTTPTLATSCITPWTTCPFPEPFLEKGEACTCVWLGGLLISEGVAQ